MVIERVFGIGHVLDASVGGQFFPGKSGGKRKQRVMLDSSFVLYQLIIKSTSVSTTEVLVAGAPVQCFDISMRRLDLSAALDFVKVLRQ